jgi:hypothetical protein
VIERQNGHRTYTSSFCDGGHALTGRLLWTDSSVNYPTLNHDMHCMIWNTRAKMVVLLQKCIPSSGKCDRPTVGIQMTQLNTHFAALLWCVNRKPANCNQTNAVVYSQALPAFRDTLSGVIHVTCEDQDQVRLLTHDAPMSDSFL